MTSYVEGKWLALVTPHSVAMLTDAPAQALSLLAGALRERGLAGFIDALTEATGTTASSLPDFAVAIAEEQGIRVAVRGTFTLADTSVNGSSTLTGLGVTGWSEAVWQDSATVEISSAETQGDGELWVVEGAVRAASVRWCPSASRPTQPSARPAPAPASPATGASSPPKKHKLPLDKVPALSNLAHIAEPHAEPSTEVDVPTTAQIPVESGEALDSAAGARPEASDDEISLETLAPANDTVSGERGEELHETEFGSLWGSTVASPPLGTTSDRGPLISALPAFTSPPPREMPDARPSVAPHGQPSPDESSAPARTPATQNPAAQNPPPPTPAAQTPAAQTPAAQTPAPEPSQAPGDHDGATVSIAALRAMTSGEPPETGEVPPFPSFATAEQLAMEGRGRAVVSTGAVVTLDKNVIIGRTPRASRVTGEMPHLVTVPSPTQDISRSHVELRVEGTAVVAIDLNTTNGTLVRRHGAEPVRLHPGEPHVLLNGDVIEIGDGITITLEDLP